jgi:hypothetical protein
MIMSKQPIPCTANHSDDGTRQSTPSAAVALVNVIGQPREVRARKVVKHVMHDFSVDRLASFGWSLDDIRRSKSV